MTENCIVRSVQLQQTDFLKVVSHAVEKNPGLLRVTKKAIRSSYPVIISRNNVVLTYNICDIIA